MDECIRLFNEIYDNYMKSYYETDEYKKYFKNMTEDEYKYLFIIYQNKKIMPSELARLAKISKPAATKIVKKFLNKGYIYKKEAEDKRAFYVSLTEDLKNNIEKSIREYNESLKKILNNLSKDEISELKVLLGKIARGTNGK